MGRWLLLPHQVTTLPAGYCYARHYCFSQGTQARGGRGNTAGTGEQDHGTRAAGSGQEVCSCIRAGGWSHIFPAAVMQTDCRPTPEPNAAACWVKNSLSSPPTPFSDRLFLTQNIYGFGLPQSPHPIAPTRMRAFKKKKAAPPLSSSPLHAPTLPNAWRQRTWAGFGSVWSSALRDTMGYFFG